MIKNFCIVLSLFFLAVQYAAAAPVSRVDFAFGRKVAATDPASFYTVKLPLDVYERVTREDLGDLRVLNADGQVIPHELIRTQRKIEVKNTTQLFSVPFFLVEGGSQKDATGSIEVSEDAEGNVIKVKVAKGAHGAKSSPAYLLDLRKVKKQVVSLVFEWTYKPGGLIPVNIEGSSDLKTWSILSSGVLAQLNYLGEEVAQKKIGVQIPSPKFLKISFPDGATPHIDSVSVEVLEQHIQTTAVQHQLIEGTRDLEKASVFYFNTKGFLPLQGLAIALPQPNMLIRAKVSSRLRETAPWIERLTATSYRLNKGATEIASSVTPLPYLLFDPYWKLEIVGKDITLGEKVPQIDFEWMPDTVRFLAQGSPPFELVYGSAKTGPADFGLPQGISDESIAPAAAALEEAHTISGDSARILPAQPVTVPWKKWLLWAVLFIGVVGISMMAYRLSKDLKAES